MRPETQIRAGIYLHLCLVAGRVVLSLADRGLFINPTISDWLSQPPVINGLFVFFLIAGFVCPIFVMVGAFRMRTDYRVVVLAFLCEVLLCIAQVEAIVPACS